MTSTSDRTSATVTTQVYRIYIKATPQAIWDAITEPEWNARYGYPRPPSTTCGPAARYRPSPRDEMRQRGHGPEVLVDGEVSRSTRPAGWCRPGGCYGPDDAAERHPADLRDRGAGDGRVAG